MQEYFDYNSILCREELKRRKEHTLPNIAQPVLYIGERNFPPSLWLQRVWDRAGSPTSRATEYPGVVAQSLLGPSSSFWISSSGEGTWRWTSLAGPRTTLRTTGVVDRNGFLESVCLASNTGSITKNKNQGKSLRLWITYCSSIPAS